MSAYWFIISILCAEVKSLKINSIICKYIVIPQDKKPLVTVTMKDTLGSAKDMVHKKISTWAHSQWALIRQSSFPLQVQVHHVGALQSILWQKPVNSFLKYIHRFSIDRLVRNNMIFLVRTFYGLFFFASFAHQKITFNWKHISIFSFRSFFLFTSSPFLKWQLFIKQIKWVGKNKNPLQQKHFVRRSCRRRCDHYCYGTSEEFLAPF
jgi:hypothetical protein